MVHVQVDGDTLICEVEGLHKLWACKSSLRIPLEHIESVEEHPADAQRWWHGWKVLGTDLPGLFAAGLFRLAGKWVFWDVTHPDKAIQINLRDDGYRELLFEVEDPEQAARLINQAIGRP